MSFLVAIRRDLWGSFVRDSKRSVDIRFVLKLIEVSQLSQNLSGSHHILFVQVVFSVHIHSMSVPSSFPFLHRSDVRINKAGLLVN